MSALSTASPCSLTMRPLTRNAGCCAVAVEAIAPTIAAQTPARRRTRRVCRMSVRALHQVVRLVQLGDRGSEVAAFVLVGRELPRVREGFRRGVHVTLHQRG